MDSIREELLKNPNFIYVGNPDMWDRLEWSSQGTSLEHLCTKYDASDESHSKVRGKAKGPSPKHVPAQLCIITTLSPSLFFLTADASWDSGKLGEFVDIRPSAIGVAPEDAQCAEDFENFYASLREHIQTKSAHALPQIKGVMKFTNEGDNPLHSLKFQHSNLFVPRGNTASEADIDFMEHWPVPKSHTDARNAFDEMKDRYLVNPILAYMNDSLIPPEKYKAELKGATVVMVFTLHRLSKSNQDTFWASISNIDVLESPPDDFFNVPSKRPAPQTNPFHLKKKGLSIGGKKSKTG
ncbi:hypothetical protein MD484_g8715, partial [Candolleomyces efflorescens]